MSSNKSVPTNRARRGRPDVRSNAAGRRILKENGLAELAPKNLKISFFGHFGWNNFGNEGTLQAILLNMRRLLPKAEFTCICDETAVTAARYNITTLPFSRPVIKFWRPKSRRVQLLRSVVLGIPSELYRWYDVSRSLKGTDALIVPGTGLLTDVYGLHGWGPYSMFKWSLLAKLRGCKLFFVSVGAGPLESRLGRGLVKFVLGLADFRSYRDASSLDYLKAIGFAPTNDLVYPDLAFSLRECVVDHQGNTNKRRPVVGLGLMSYGGMYNGEISDIAYQKYMKSLVVLVKWLLDHEYDIRLLIGELGDPVDEFRNFLMNKYRRTIPIVS